MWLAGRLHQRFGNDFAYVTLGFILLSELYQPSKGLRVILIYSKNRKIRCHQGFTLIELLIVLIILSILAAIVYPMYSDSTHSSTNAVAITLVQGVVKKIDIYKLKHGSWPSSIQSEWFRGYKLPVNPFVPGHTRSINDDLDGSKINKWHPYGKTTELYPFWYNPLNGAFRMRVPAQRTDAETLALYNMINKTSVSGMSSSSRF